MSVRKKDRHISKQECLQKSRELMKYILILTRSREFDPEGKQVQKPGILGEGQALWAFGTDLLKCGKAIHSCCYQAVNKHLDKKSYEEIQNYYKKAIEYCDSIFRQIDYCIFQYANNNKKKRNSFEHLAKLTKITKTSIQDRMNRNKIIIENKY